MQFEAFFGIRRSDRSNVRASEGSGTTTMDSNFNPWQVFNLSASRTVVLPTTNIKAGDRIVLENQGAFDLIVQASNASALTTANGTNYDATIQIGSVYLEALQDTPSTPAHWRVINVYEDYFLTGTSSGAITATYQIRFRRQNKAINFKFATTSASASASADINLGPVATRFRPAAITNGPCVTCSGNVVMPGKMQMDTSGNISVRKYDNSNYSGSSGLFSNSGALGDDSVCGSYTII